MNKEEMQKAIKQMKQAIKVMETSLELEAEEQNTTQSTTRFGVVGAN